LLNLFNTAAYVKQSTFYASAFPGLSNLTSVSRCDGDVIDMDIGNTPLTTDWAYTKRVIFDVPGTQIDP
jgi:hypothetical protein